MREMIMDSSKCIISDFCIIMSKREKQRCGSKMEDANSILWKHICFSMYVPIFNAEVQCNESMFLEKCNCFMGADLLAVTAANTIHAVRIFPDGDIKLTFLLT